jgi:hypothetical protein
MHVILKNQPSWCISFAQVRLAAIRESFPAERTCIDYHQLAQLIPKRQIDAIHQVHRHE